MARGPRRPSESGIHHIMNRGTDHHMVFRSDDDRIEFGRLLAWMHRELGVVTLAYCLMGNHYHLVLRAPPDTLSEAMKQLGQVFTQRLNQRVERDGAVFRGRFCSIPIETDAYLLNAVRYVHLNPLDIAGVEHPADHRWSSYPAYRELRAAPFFLDVEPVMSLLGGQLEELIGFTEHDLRPSTGPRPDRRPVTVDDVVLMVDGALAVETFDHPTTAPGNRVAHTVLVLVAARCPDRRLRADLMADLCGPSAASFARSSRRARHRLATDATVGRMLAWVEGGLAA